MAKGTLLNLGPGRRKSDLDEDVLPIFQRECQLCHRPSGQNLSGMIAPIEWPESGWTIGDGEPDLIVGFDEPNWVGDEVDDLYQNITVRVSKDAHAKDRWIQSIEFKPGSEVVHHIIAFQATPNSSLSHRLCR